MDAARGASWSDDEVIQRWTRLYRGVLVAQHYLGGKTLNEAETAQLASLVERWRERLSSLSWFMRCLNEYLARQANAEDGCKGRFWEARFKSQALLDDSALLSCMTYVDLNPIRAGIAHSLEESDFTSIQQRICQAQDYLDLIDWTGRAVRPDKKGFIDEKQPRLLATFGLSVEEWQVLALHIQKQAITMFNGLERIEAMKKRKGAAEKA